MDGVSTGRYEEHLNLRRFFFIGVGAGLTLLIQCSFQLLQLALQSSQEPSRLSATRAIVKTPSHMSMSLSSVSSDDEARSKQEYAREEKAKDKVGEHTCGKDPPLLLNETKVRIFIARHIGHGAE